MRPKKSDSAIYVIMGFILFVVVSFLLLHFSAYKEAFPTADFQVLIQSTALGISSHPFSFVAMPQNIPAYMGASSVILLLCAAYAKIDYERNKRDIAARIQDGSSRFMTDSDVKSFTKRYASPKGVKKINHINNTIISQRLYLSMDTRMTRRNLNILVIGGSGSGKSRFFVKPNLLEMPLNCSFACTDPSGELIESVGKFLEDNGYKIKKFNLVDMKDSNRYNPLNYVRGEDDVIILVDTILKNTKDPNASGGEAFWEQSQQMMLQAFVGALYKFNDILEFNGQVGIPKTLETIMSFMRACTISEKESSSTNAVDKMFEKLRNDLKQKGILNDFCLQQYDEFKIGTGKTLKNILISAMARLSTFDSEGLRELTSDDDIHLDKLGDEKTALFIVLPTANKTFNFVASMMYAQLFQTLYYKAERECSGNYVVYDRDGEVVKVFEVPHFNVFEEDTDLNAVEEKIDIVAAKKAIKKKKKKKRKLNKDEKEELKEGIKEAKEAADLFVTNAKNVEVFKKGSKYITKVNDEIVAWYGSEEIAILHADRLKSCYVKKLGLRLPFHVRFLLDEFANSVTRSTPNTVGITDKSVA